MLKFTYINIFGKRNKTESDRLVMRVEKNNNKNKDKEQ